jgi:peptide/nickel transport system ATP-binding protein
VRKPRLRRVLDPVGGRPDRLELVRGPPVTEALLEIEDLAVGFDTEAGLLRAVDRVSLEVEAGSTVGLVGESGCGKSVTAASVLRLVPIPPGQILHGEIRLAGRGDLLALPADELSGVRGMEIAMIFQDPMTSLNPVFTVEKQMREVLALRFGMDRATARARSVGMLRTVGLSDPEERLRAYPHELSGGMKQRVMIAMALLAEPKLLIADEPTTALDVTIQAQILHLIRELQRRTGAAVLFITHDMGVVAEMCDRLAVMYAGRIVERGDVLEIFEHARHPYTVGLLRSIPREGMTPKGELPTIEGTVPSPFDLPAGCRFAPRCWKRKTLDEAAQKRCRDDDPTLEAKAGSGPGSMAACHWPVVDGER